MDSQIHVSLKKPMPKYLNSIPIVQRICKSMYTFTGDGINTKSNNSFWVENDQNIFKLGAC